jgi:hypothetical protein
MMRWFAFVLPLSLAFVPVPAEAAAKPTITSLSPSSAIAGGTGFTLTVNGKDFVADAKAKWGTTALTTTYKSATLLTAAVPASLIAKAGTASVTVTTSGGTSAVATFTIKQPKPVLTSLSPNSAFAGGPAFTLTIEGKNFIAGAKAKWLASTLTTTVKSSTVLTATVPADLIAKAGTASVTVTTSGGTSAAATFTIKQPKPVLTSLSPNSAIAGSPAFTLAIKGKDFIKGATVEWGSTKLTTTYKTSILLTAAVPASLIAKQGTAKVTVTTTGGTSTAAVFTIGPAKPVITSLSPKSAISGGSGFTLTINGYNFASGATAYWGTTALVTTYTSPILLSAAVPASLITTAGSASITVTTSIGTSAPASFTIVPPLPTIATLSPASVTAGGPAFTLTVNGTNFVQGATVNWGTTKLATTYVSAIELTAAVPASLIVSVGTANITVNTPGGTSAPATFTILAYTGPACRPDGTGNAKLNGVYSFQFVQIDPTNDGELNFNAGAFTADGKGNITVGQTDSNGPYYTSAEQNTFTGTYSVGSDDRGLFTLNYTGGATSYVCFALDSFAGGIAGSGRLVSDDVNPQVDSGAFYLQGESNPGVASVKGSWALGMQGIELDSSNGQPLPMRGASVGYLTLDGNGNVTKGELDISQDKLVSGSLGNNLASQVGATGTYTLASTGRGTITLNLAGGGTSDYVFYVAGSNQILLLSSDTGGQGGSAVEAGKAYLRTTTSFSNATLSGTSVAVGQALSDTNSGQYDQRLVEAGILSWTSPGKYSESYDQNDAGNVSLEQASSGTYSVDADGRATLNDTSPATYAYLVGPNQGFGVQGNLGVGFTYFESQTVPAKGFTASSFDGGYSEGSIWYGFEAQKASSGEVASNGTGGLSGTLDVAPFLNGCVDCASAPRAAGTAVPSKVGVHAMDVGVTETYTSATNGRFVVSNGGVPMQALYLVSPSKAYAIDISGAIWQPLEEFNHQ